MPLSVCLSVCLSLCLSVYMTLSPSDASVLFSTSHIRTSDASVRLPVFLSICLSFAHSIFLSVPRMLLPCVFLFFRPRLFPLPIPEDQNNRFKLEHHRFFVPFFVPSFSPSSCLFFSRDLWELDLSSLISSGLFIICHDILFPP